MSKFKKTFKRILEVYITEEKEFQKSEPKLGDDAFDALMKKSKGRVIDQFLSAKIVSLEIDKLIKTHRGTFYSLQDMLWKIDDDEPIHVVKHKGKYLVLDGHHRVLIHRITGKKKINAFLVNLDKRRKKKRK